ncbi:hypothetical protein D3C72_1044560 [compost metagenome]
MPVVIAVLVDKAHLHRPRHQLPLVIEVEDLEGKRLSPLYPIRHKISLECRPLAARGPAILGAAAIDGAATGLGKGDPIGHLQRPEGAHPIEFISKRKSPLPLRIEGETSRLKIPGLLGEQHVPQSELLPLGKGHGGAA